MISNVQIKIKLLRLIVFRTHYFYWTRRWFVMKYAVNKLTLFVCQMSFILAGQRREHKCGRRNWEPLIKLPKKNNFYRFSTFHFFRWILSHQFQYLDLCTGNEGPQEQINLRSETLKSEFQMTAAVPDQPN